MEESFTIPARPWTDADVALLTRNAGMLDEETRAELGLTPVAPIEDFKAEQDVNHNTPLADVEEDTIVVTQEILDENPVLAEAGVEVGDIGVATDDVPEGAMIEDEVVNNEHTDKD